MRAAASADAAAVVGSERDIGARRLRVAGSACVQRIGLLIRRGACIVALEQVLEDRLDLLHVAVLHRVDEDLLFPRRTGIQLRDDLTDFGQGFPRSRDDDRVGARIGYCNDRGAVSRRAAAATASPAGAGLPTTAPAAGCGNGRHRGSTAA